jgi:hypothetical protein
MGLSDRIPLNPLVKSSFLHGFPMNITIIWGICRGFQAHPHGLRSVHFKHHSWHMLMTRTSLKVGCPLNCIDLTVDTKGWFIISRCLLLRLLLTFF